MDIADLATLYVGTYSVRGSLGIYEICVELGSGTMRIASAAAAQDASYLTLSPDGQVVYAVEEAVSAADRRATVAAYAVVRCGELSLQEQLPIPGVAPCHLDVSPDGRWLVTSNYSDGSNTLVSVGASGAAAQVAHYNSNSGEVGPHARQDAPHAHSAYFAAPSAGEPWLVFTCDLGMDQVIVFRLDPQKGSLEPVPGGSMALPAGAGPRHLAFHPQLPLAYVLGELNSVVYVVGYDKRGGSGVQLDLLQSSPTLPAGSDGVETYGAAIRVDPDGQFVTVSNRGRDTLATLSIDPGTGLLEWVGEAPCGGHWPRDFAYVGRDLLIVANERSDALAAFRPGPDGVPAAIESPGARLTVPSPTCVAVAAPRR